MVANPSFPLLEVVAIADTTTLIVAGPGVDKLTDGDELYILAVGEGLVPKTNAPFVIPKGKVEVTFPAGVYAIVRTPIEEISQPSSFAAIQYALGEATRLVSRRHPLEVDQAAMIGMPRKSPVKVGDPVVRTKDLASYIQYRAETAQETAAPMK